MNQNYAYREDNKGKYYNLLMRDGKVVFEPVAVPSHVAAARKEERRKRELARQVEDNRARSLHMNPRLILFFTAALLVCGIVCSIYISLYSEVTTRINRIARLQTEVSELVADNNTYENQLSATMNLFEIQKQAEDVLGMKTPEKDQIIYYTVEDQDYMITYSDVD